MAQQVLRAAVPLGPDGLWGSRNYATTPKTCLLAADGVDYYGGIISREGGALRYTTATGILATTVAIVGGHDFWPTRTSQEPVIFCSNGAIMRDGGNGLFTATLATGLTASGISPVFVQGGQEAASLSRKLFVFTGVNTPRVIAGSGAATASGIGSPPSDWSGSNQPSFGFIAGNRLWAGGTPTNPHMLYYSQPTNHEVFTNSSSTGTGAGTMLVYPGQGEYLMAGVEFKGFIVVWKYPKGIYLIDTRDPNVAFWTIQTQSRNVGLCGPNAWCNVDDDILFMDTAGQIQSLSRTGPEVFSSVPVSDVKQMRDFITDNIDTSRLWAAKMVYYAYKREVHVAVTSSSGTLNDRRLIIDLNKPGNVRFRWSSRDSCEALWLQKDSDKIERPMVGDSGGRVWRLDYDSQTKEGDYTSQFQTANMDFSDLDAGFATRDKNGKFLEITYEQTGNYTLYADIYWDERFEETVTFRMGTDTSGFTYTFPVVFAQRGRLAVARTRITGSGRRFSVVFRMKTANQDFKLADCFLGFTPGNEKADF